MVEQTFRSPSFFEREIDLTQRVQAPLGIPAGVIGTADKGPAFVPVTVGSMPDFRANFGNLNPKKLGPYAANEHLKNRPALTFCRILGAGANDTTADINATQVKGTVLNAGFVLDGQAPASVANGARETGGVVFIAAKHVDQADEAFGYPIYTDNDSFGSGEAFIIRAMIMLASGTRLLVLDGNESVDATFSDADDQATLGTTGPEQGKFKIIISSSAATYATTDGLSGIKVLTASLNPSSEDYIANILNTNPERFSTEEHLLYADYYVENELMTISTDVGSIQLVSGTNETSTSSGDPAETFSDVYGRFDTRFTTPASTYVISQPYGTKEFDLFRFEALSDGTYANDKLKVSIINVRKSTNPSSEFGTFSVQVRTFSDNDFAPQVLEQYPNCDLNPSSENYIGKVIGDTKVFYNFDADSDDERRLIVQGQFPNRSNLIRVVIHPSVRDRIVPASVLPFGFRGPEVLNTSDALGDINGTIEPNLPAKRLTAYAASLSEPNLTGSVIPPLPLAFKVTRGAVSTTPGFVGQPGIQEITDSRIYWGVKTTRVAQAGALTTPALNANTSNVTNPLVRTYTKFQGIGKLDALVTGSKADLFNNNKFTLARVALSNETVADVTGAANIHMREAAYIRNGTPDSNDYRIIDSLSNSKRVTLGTLVNLTSSVEFNRFSDYAKFTGLLYGGFDGLNILDINASRMNDKASAFDAGGGASTSFISPGLNTNVAGTGLKNNAIASYRSAIRIMTDEFTVNTNLLAIPGIRDPFITDFARLRAREFGYLMFVEDLPNYDEKINRLYDDSEVEPDVRQTAEQFDVRAIDNNYSAVYFPNVVINDTDNNRRVKVPASVAAIGALAFNDRVGFPWFAPAGFNRGGLDFVTNTDVRLRKSDRDRLQDSRINPIANFPRLGTDQTFVIFGQRTLQQARSALDRVNVRRMLLETKRIIRDITQQGFVFEQNNVATRQRWISQVAPRLALIQAQQGIESFKVTMDETNNTQQDIENNRLKGQIVIVPTRTIEFIVMDFIVTNSGVEFTA